MLVFTCSAYVLSAKSDLTEAIEICILFWTIVDMRCPLGKDWYFVHMLKTKPRFA